MNNINLKAYLANEGMTLKDFSAKLQYTHCYISDVIHGRANPSKRLIRDISKATNGIVKLETKLRKNNDNEKKHAENK